MVVDVEAHPSPKQLFHFHLRLLRRWHLRDAALWLLLIHGYSLHMWVTYAAVSSLVVATYTPQSQLIAAIEKTVFLLVVASAEIRCWLRLGPVDAAIIPLLCRRRCCLTLFSCITLEHVCSTTDVLGV